jgi:hypothetical protein
VPQLDVNSPTNMSPSPRKRKRSLRRSLMGLYEAPKFIYRMSLIKRIDSFLAMLEYATVVWPRKRRIPLDVDAMLAQWREAVVQITLAHDKKQVDEWEHKLNDLLEPFLKAPVEQIREFCSRLVAELEADQRVPFFIAQSVRAFVKVIVAEAKDDGILELKRDIAGRIARAVEGDGAAATRRGDYQRLNVARSSDASQGRGCDQEGRQGQVRRQGVVPVFGSRRRDSDVMNTDAELLALWKKRAMELDKKLGWMRHVLRATDRHGLTPEWRNGCLSMLDETEDELSTFLKSVGY